MTAPAVPRETKAAAKPPRPVASLDDILLELVDIDDNVRDDVGDLSELQASIAELGLLSPVKVTAQPTGRYRLVYGQRRVLACRAIGRTKISAIVEPASDVDQVGARRSIEQLAENLQRKDLNPIEEAVALREVLDADPSLTQEALADQLAMSRPWVSNTLGLLDAAPVVQEHVRAGTLSAAHAKALRGLSVEDQAEQAEKAVSGGWSAHDTERNAKYAKDNAKSRAADRVRAKKRVDEAILLLEKVVNRDTATIGVADYAGTQSEIQAALKADGWTTVAGHTLHVVSQAGECGCKGAWRLEVPYNATQGVKLLPACRSDEHAIARRKAQDEKWERQRKTQDAERKAEAAVAAGRAKRLGAWLAEHPRDLFSRRLLIHAITDGDSDELVEKYLAGESDDATDARDDATWDAICGIPEEDLAKVLAAAVAESVLDSWRLSKTVRQEIDDRAPAPKPAPKPAKGKKAAPA